MEFGHYLVLAMFSSQYVIEWLSTHLKLEVDLRLVMQKQMGIVRNKV